MGVDKRTITRVTAGNYPQYVQFDRGDEVVEVRIGEYSVGLVEQDLVEAVVALGLAARVCETDREIRVTDAWLDAVQKGEQADISDAARRYFVRVWEVEHPE